MSVGESVSEAFGLLLTGKRPGGETEMSTRYSGIDVGREQVLLGVDRELRRHILIPVDSDFDETDRVSRSVKLAPRVLQTRNGIQTYADLSCEIPRLGQVFEGLVESLLERLGDSTHPKDAVSQTLGDWRALLQKAVADIPREVVLGIVGELEILQILAERDPNAIEWWQGPAGGEHDFARSGRAIEVKATAGVDGNIVRVSNLDQLDPSLVDDLHLAVVHLKDSVDAPSIDERVERLIETGVAAADLERALGLLGYVRGISDSVHTRFEVRSIRWWEVGDDFPGIRSSDVEPQRLQAVRKVSYDLMLAAAPAPHDDQHVTVFIDDWLGS